jgi:hypothetical protein
VILEKQFSDLLGSAATNEDRSRAHYLWGCVLARESRWQKALNIFMEGLEFAERTIMRGRYETQIARMYLWLGNSTTSDALRHAEAAIEALKGFTGSGEYAVALWLLAEIKEQIARPIQLIDNRLEHNLSRTVYGRRLPSLL